MIRIHLFLAFLLLAVSPGIASAQRIIQWETGYPKTGSNSGEISVKGTITADAGWIPDSQVTVRVWISGEESQGFVVAVTYSGSGYGYEFEGTATGLVSSSNYNLIVTVGFSDFCMGPPEIFGTAPTTATAK